MKISDDIFLTMNCFFLGYHYGSEVWKCVSMCVCENMRGDV